MSLMPKARGATGEFLRVVGRKVRRGVRTLTASDLVALRYQGQLDGTGAPVTFAFVERAPFAKDFEFLLGASGKSPIAPPETLFSGNLVQYAMARAEVEALLQSADLAIRETFLSPDERDDEFSLHAFFDGHLPVAATLEAQLEGLRSEAHRRRLQKALKSSTEVARVSTAMEDFEHFYDVLHAPFVKERFGLAASLDPKEVLREQFASQGKLLLLSRGDEVIAGTLLLDRGNGVLTYHRNGFAGGGKLSGSQLSERTAALELALFRHAHDGGFRFIDFGFCKGVVTDGLFIHKRRMGCIFVAPEHSPLLRMRVKRSLSPAVFSRFPMLTGRNGELALRVGFTASTASKPQAEWATVMADWRVEGLREVKVFTGAPADHEAFKTWDAALRETMAGLPIHFERC